VVLIVTGVLHAQVEIKNFFSRSPSFLPGLADVLEREFMDKDLVIGSVKQIKRTVKQAACKAVGDTKLKSEGQRRQDRGQGSERHHRPQGRA
jgi:uncharacterized protein YjbJ (UPF0337 family)